MFYIRKFFLSTKYLLYDNKTHIDNQYLAFKNIHDMCKVDGIFIHVLPRENYWMGHCRYKYNIEFFEKLASHNNYEIMTLKIEDDKDIFCSIRKTKSENSELRDIFSRNERC